MNASGPTFTQSLIAYFRGWRYPFFGTVFLYLLMFLGWVAVGGGLGSSALHIGLGAFAATSLLFGIFLINDAADRHVDARVHPDRPIPRGLASWKHIYITAVALLVTACAVSALVNVRSLAVAIAMTVYALFFYGWAKGGLDVPGSSEILTPIVSALFPLYALQVAECNDLRVVAGVVGYIYLADFSQDLLGGIHDQAGDRVGNVRTFALAIGPRPTLVVSLFGFLVATSFSVSLFLLGSLGVVYVAIVLGVTVTMFVLYARLFGAARAASGAEDPELLGRADRANHLAGMFFFIVSAATFLDHVSRRFLAR
ncbi:MAG: geranylgeranylglycerol-phosphate geranylgeranyltransferase [Myxococcaceae bacterium]|nr:geranylgeranylglycerol-phosphate geranylgeranyltransferase [Myxococcaceae bacterium]